MLRIDEEVFHDISTTQRKEAKISASQKTWYFERNL